MSDPDLLARIEDLERRLRLLEQRGSTPPTPFTPPPLQATPQPEPPESLTDRLTRLRDRYVSPSAPLPEAPHPAPVAPRSTHSPVPISPPLLPRTPTPEPKQTPEPTATPSPPSPPKTQSIPKPQLLSSTSPSSDLPYLPYSSPPPAPPPPPSARTWERVVGLKWTAWLGALILVVGSGLGIKFAYDQGWLGGMPPLIRWVLLMLGALSFLPAGEWAYRKVNRLASVGFFATGIALCFLVAYAGHAYFELYGGNTAFILMAASALIGAAVSIRGDLVSIALVALLGAHITPLVIGGEPNLRGFLIYLSALHLLALLLAGRGSGPDGGKWWLLRGFSLAASALWTLSIALQTESLPWQAVLFSAVVATLAHIELAFSAARPRSAPSITSPHPPLATALASTHAASARTYALLLTAFPALTVAFLYRGNDPRLLYFAAAASTLLAASAYLFRHLASPSTPTLSESPTPRQTALLALDDVYRLKSLSLLALGITGGLSGTTQYAAYIALAFLLALFALLVPVPQIIRRSYAATFALLLPLATLARCTFDLGRLLDNGFSPARTPFAGIPLLPTAANLALAALAAHLTTYLASHPRPLSTSHPLLRTAIAPVSALATAALIFALIFLSTPATGVILLVLAAAIWSVLGILQPGWIARLSPLRHAWALLVVASVDWLLFVALGPRLADTYTPSSELLLLNPTALSGLLCAAAIFALAWSIRRFRPPQLVEEIGTQGLPMVLALTAATALTFLVGLSEIDRTIGTAREFLSLHANLARILLTLAWAALCTFTWSTLSRRLAHPTLATQLLAGAAALSSLLCVVTAVASIVSLDGSIPSLANLPVVVSLLVAASALLHAHALRSGPTFPSASAGIFAGALLFATGAVELLRQHKSFTTLGLPSGFATINLLGLWGTAFSLLFGVLAHRFARTWTAHHAFLTTSALALLASAVFSTFFSQWLVWLTGTWSRGTLLANLQLASAILTLAALFALHWLWRHRWSTPLSSSPPLRPSLKFIRTSGTLIAALTFFAASSSEVARLLTALSGGGAARGDRLISTGYSIWWALLALAVILAGFRWKYALARYTGLALFGLTLLKVVFIDLSGAAQGWRILSFLALGALLLATSLLYGKLAPLLLDPPTPNPSPLPPTPQNPNPTPPTPPPIS